MEVEGLRSHAFLAWIIHTLQNPSGNCPRNTRNTQKFLDIFFSRISRVSRAKKNMHEKNYAFLLFFRAFPRVPWAALRALSCYQFQHGIIMMAGLA